MAKYTSPQDMHIAALDKKTVQASVNLMVSGDGIPWEDRGSIGFMGAFFKTALGAMFKPTQLLSKMRRPETAKDAKIFAYACGGIWFVAVLIQSAFAYFVFYSRDHSLDLDPQQYVINTLLEGLLAGAAAAIMPKIITWMFYRLTAFDMTSKAPPVLVYNCITYLGGVCLLALIPGGPRPWLAIGPALAGLWMFVTLMTVAIARLRVRVGAAIIGSILTLLGTAGVVVAGIFVVWLVWCNLLAKDSVPPIVPLTTVHQ
ncbi:MAG TPA: hypothetical protein VHX86_00855 [Tepidisphaeraceae bacterium]|nr:hypothetical protein [Tepidisphaeraceae bacterium]